LSPPEGLFSLAQDRQVLGKPSPISHARRALFSPITAQKIITTTAIHTIPYPPKQKGRQLSPTALKTKPTALSCRLAPNSIFLEYQLEGGKKGTFSKFIFPLFSSAYNEN